MSQRTLGWALIAFSAIGTAALFIGAYYVDTAHGITVAQSLHMWGL